MSKRTKPKDPFRDVRRRVMNEQLAERLRQRFETMYRLLLGKHVPVAKLDGTPAERTEATIAAHRAREVAIDFAVANRSTRRLVFGERGLRRDEPRTMKVPKGR